MNERINKKGLDCKALPKQLSLVEANHCNAIIIENMRYDDGEWILMNSINR